jgi:hypothetical protein
MVCISRKKFTRQSTERRSSDDDDDDDNNNDNGNVENIGNVDLPYVYEALSANYYWQFHCHLSPTSTINLRHTSQTAFTQKLQYFQRICEFSTSIFRTAKTTTR